ncbi:MAG TPA: alpha-glucosidase, partial [Sphaerochaeta sp.]|nr:alpha-glucosidase [Sphaerochaeta sp.]
MLRFVEDGKLIDFNGKMFATPDVRVGKGGSDISMYRGNFKVKEQKVAWRSLEPKVSGKEIVYTGEGAEIKLSPIEENGFLMLDFSVARSDFNRYQLRFPTDPGEAVYGGGEQYSRFNLRGRKFPIMTREQGVGRSYKRLFTILSELHDKAGGAYHTTYYPQPTFVSSANYFIHVFSFDYSVLDFTSNKYHAIMSYSMPKRIAVGFGENLMETASKVSLLLGRQAPLPSWVHDGMILGVQGGTEVVKKKLDKTLAAGVKVCGLWAQDWVGKCVTSFGSRLIWNWEWNQEMYPGLDKWMPELEKQGIFFTIYINPYLRKDYSMCNEAAEKGYLVKDKDGKDYYVDFGEFDCAHVDLTNPDAYA